MPLQGTPEAWGSSFHPLRFFYPSSAYKSKWRKFQLSCNSCPYSNLDQFFVVWPTPHFPGTELIFYEKLSLCHILCGLDELIARKKVHVAKDDQSQNSSLTSWWYLFWSTCPNQSKFKLILDFAGGIPFLFGVAENVGCNPETAHGPLATRRKGLVWKWSQYIGKHNSETEKEFRCCSLNSWI